MTYLNLLSTLKCDSKTSLMTKLNVNITKKLCYQDQLLLGTKQSKIGVNKRLLLEILHGTF